MLDRLKKLGGHFSPIILIYVLTACGGGGDNPPVIYSGLTTPAKITKETSKTIQDLFLPYTIFSTNLSQELTSPAKFKPNYFSDGSKKSIYSVKRNAFGKKNIAQSFNETINCDSGVFNVDGRINDYGIGVVNYTYNDCVFSGIKTNGVISEQIDHVNLQTGEIVNEVLFYKKIRRSGVGIDNQIDGTVKYLQNGMTNSGIHTVTIIHDTVSIDNISGVITKEENLNELLKSIPGYTSSNSSETRLFLVEHLITGRIYRSDLGYIDVSTPTIVNIIKPANYVTPYENYPYFSGEMIVKGENQVRMSFEPYDQNSMMSSLDLDGDGTFEWQRWHRLPDNIETNQDRTPEVVLKDSGETAFEYVYMQAEYLLDARKSVDPDGDYIQAEWTLISKPSDSTAALGHQSNGLKAYFNPDVLGEYTFSVTVSDGKHQSPPKIKKLQFYNHLYEPRFNINIYPEYYLNAAGKITNIINEPDSNLIYWKRCIYDYCYIDYYDKNLNTITPITSTIGAFIATINNDEPILYVSTWFDAKSYLINNDFNLSNTYKIEYLEGLNNPPTLWSSDSGHVYRYISPRNFSEQSGIYALDKTTQNFNLLIKSTEKYGSGINTGKDRLVVANQDGFLLINTQAGLWEEISLLPMNNIDLSGELWINPKTNVFYDRNGKGYIVANDTITQATGIQIPQINGLNTPVKGMQFSPDGQYLAFWYDIKGGDIYLASTNDGAVIKTIDLPPYYVDYWPELVIFDGNSLNVLAQSNPRPSYYPSYAMLRLRVF